MQSVSLRLTIYQKIAEHAITMLVNLSSDQEVLEFLAKDEKFLGIVFDLIVVCSKVQEAGYQSLTRRLEP
jgi:hypothetical protein